MDLNGAAFHGRWQLCEFLIEHGADADKPLASTGESPLHSAICKPSTLAFNRVVRILLKHGADPNRVTIPGIDTDSFMRDCRTRGETPLHRAAAFGDAEVIQTLLDAGADRTARDANGDTPLSWASWHLRPRPILQMLCYGHFSVSVNRLS
jgi:ankyrin repeat protein